MVVRVRGVLQVAGRSNLADELRARLNDADFRRFRFSVAFARWSGLHLIDGELQGFAARSGNAVDGLVGIDLGGTTIEALTYLSELPNTRMRVVRSGMPNVVFHPKIYAFDGPDKWSVIVGSSNLSTGGLLANIEGSLIVEGRSGTDPCPGDAFFAPFDAAPFKPEHVRPIDEALLAELAPVLARYEQRPPDINIHKMTKGVPPLDSAFKPPRPPGRPPTAGGAGGSSTSKQTKRRPRGRVTTSATVPTGPKELYMELWDETGGGTQVQMAKKVFTEYFGADTHAVTYIELKTPAGRLGPIRLQQFGNSTFRIGLPFVGGSTRGAGRRGVLRFRRVGKDRYDVALRLKGVTGYPTWFGYCTEQRGPNSKRFGLR